MEQRLRRLKGRMKKEGLDSLLVTDLKNVHYLTGFTGSSARLFLGRRVHFFTDFRYQEQSRFEVTSKAIIHIIKKRYPLEIADLEELHGNKDQIKIGFESSHLSVAEFEQYKKDFRARKIMVKWVPVTGLIEGLRVVKDTDEIELIAKAASITDKVFKEVCTLIKPGVTERDLAAEIEYRFLKYTGLPAAFSTIVASGPHSAMPHAKPTTRKLQKGDFLTFDMGCQWKGYASDFTRTVVIGKATAKHKEIYSIVRDAHHRCIEGLHAGISGIQADALARDHITQKGYGDYFGHSTGHGVGLDIHEAPRLSAMYDKILPAGSVVTVEPGIYLPDWGGVRIEDLVVITKEGVRVLSRTPRDKLIEF